MANTDSAAFVIGANDTAIVPGMVTSQSAHNILCPSCGSYTDMDGRHQARYGANICYLALLCHCCGHPIYGYIPLRQPMQSITTVEF